MHLQHIALDQFAQQVAPLCPQQVAPFARTRSTTTDRQTSLLAGSDRHVLGVLREAYPRVRCHRTPRPRGPFAWRIVGWRGRRGGQGLCVGFDVSLFEVVGVGLFNCQEVGVVKRVDTLLGGGHRLAAALKVVEEVQEDEDESQDEEVERNGGLKVEIRLSCDDHEMTRTSKT